MSGALPKMGTQMMSNTQGSARNASRPIQTDAAEASTIASPKVRHCAAVAGYALRWLPSTRA